jgi:hypothetical protein
MKISAKTQARKEQFQKLGALISRHQGPTLFNPHYEIHARKSQCKELTAAGGPALKTLQWEPTGRR